MPKNKNNVVRVELCMNEVMRSEVVEELAKHGHTMPDDLECVFVEVPVKEEE